MNLFRLIALCLLFALAASSAAAYHDAYIAYPSYGGFSHNYEHSYNAESVSVRESEFEHVDTSASDWWYNDYHSTTHYDYGRSREFSFSRVSDYTRQGMTTDLGYGLRPYSYPYVYRAGSAYAYPYSSFGPDDRRLFSEYYPYGKTSPYYNPAYASRAGYSRYLPYGY
jgi:hypothetical protein